MKADKPTFILGLGAQKAGTSWLRAQLNKCAPVNMGFVKEYHVWDYVHLFSEAWRAKVNANTAEIKNPIQVEMRHVAGAYERYFTSLIRNEIRFTGDITPSYAGLNASQLSEIKGKLEHAGFRVKVIFVMRDPAERNWSAMRMLHREGQLAIRDASQEELLERFAFFIQRQNMITRTRYDHTVQAIRESFDENDRLFAIYEDMFNADFMGRLSAFLDLDLNGMDLREKIYAGSGIRLPKAQYDTCRDFHSEVYAFCAEAFPMTRELWRWTP